MRKFDKVFNMQGSKECEKDGGKWIAKDKMCEYADPSQVRTVL
jgi:hypothetical protein